MAAILKLRRGTSIPSLSESELFYHQTLDTLIVGDGSNSHILLKSGSNSVDYVSLSGDLTASNIRVNNDIRIGGNIYLGDSLANDNINVQASLSGSLIPSASSEYDLGSPTRYWRNAYITNATILDITLPGSNIVSGSSQLTSSYDIRYLNTDGDGVVSSSVQIDHDATTNFVANEHINHTSVTIFAGSGLVGGGTIAESRTISLSTGSAHFNGGVKTKLNTEGVISGSGQLTTEFDERYLNTNGDAVVSSSQQISDYNTFLEINGDSVVSSSQQISDYNTFLEINGDSVVSSSQQISNYNVFAELNGDSLVSSSQQISNYNTFLEINGMDVVSGSSQVTESLDDRYLEINGDEVVSSSQQISHYNDFLEINGMNVVSSSQQISDYNVFLEINGDGVVSQSLLNDLTDDEVNQLKNINNTTISIAQWEYLGASDQGIATTNDVTFNTGSFTGNVTVNGNLVVLGSATEIQTSELRIEDKLITIASGSSNSTEADGAGIEIDGAGASMTWNHSEQLMEFDTKVSSSIGFKGNGSELINIQYNNIEFGGSGIVSGSDQVSGSIYGDISGDISINNLGVASITSNTIVNSDIKSDAEISYTKLDLRGSNIISQSSQLIPEFDGRYLNTYGDSVVSSSQQISNYNTFLEINGMSVVSGSEQVTQSLDTRYLKINGDNVFSSSVQVNADNVSNFDSNVLEYINSLSVISGSDQVTSSLDIRYLNHDGDNVVSGSSQVTESLDLRYEPIADGTHTLISSSTYSVPSQGTLRTVVNGLQEDIDLGLQSGDTPSFDGLYLTGTPSLNDTHFTAFFSGSGGIVGKRTLATAAFYHVSNSIDDGNPAVLGNAGAVKAYVDGKIIDASAGDITAVLPIIGGGLFGGGYAGDVSMSIDTGSNHFGQGVLNALTGSGIISSSEQIDLNFFDIDGLVSSSTQISEYNTFLEINGMSVISGSEQVDLTQTTNYVSGIKGRLNAEGVISGSSQVLGGSGIVSSSEQISNYNTFLEINGDGVISGSEQVDLTQTTNYVSGIKTRLNAEGVISGSSQIIGGSGIVSSSEQISNYNTFLEINGDSVVSSSQQISNYNTFLEINGDGVFSGSSQVNADTITNFDSNVKDKMNLDGVISGSEQITPLLPTGVVSGSDQLTSSYDDRYVTLATEQTISGLKTFNDIVVNGTGSFAYIESVTGTAKIIGDSHVVVNASTPTSRYAGLSVYDSGSVISTASFQFDGQTNDWHYEYSSSAGIDYAVTLFGPEYSTKGSPIYLTDNRIPKSTDNHHLIDSNISDSGTLITLGSAVDVSGVTNFNNTTQSTTKTTGAVIIDGGVGIAKTLNVGEDVVAYASSDERLKDNIEPIKNSLDKINSIGGYSFTWNEEKQHIYKGKDYGVIAQEIEKILPELVDTRENGYKAVKYDKLVSLLIEGIKDLSKEVQELKNKLG